MSPDILTVRYWTIPGTQQFKQAYSEILLVVYCGSGLYWS